jgi:hypothetical protein
VAGMAEEQGVASRLASVDGGCLSNSASRFREDSQVTARMPADDAPKAAGLPVQAGRPFVAEEDGHAAG